MRSVYYDTSRHKLLRAGYRLSIRTQSGKRFQDVELATVAALAAVPCWSTAIDEDGPGDASLADTPLADILGDAAAGKLKPVFVVDLRRRSATLERAGSTIAASFDTGTIDAEGAVERICELRLELVSGAPEALLDLARELGSAVPLTLILRPPGERGFRLLPAQADRPVGDPSIELLPAMTTRAAADGICRGCAAALLEGLAQLSSGGGQDALHRTRIGLRRLRALLWFLKPVLGVEAALLAGRLRSFAQFLGAARELDVFCDRVLAPLQRANPDAPGADALFESFDRRRQDEHEKVLAFVQSPAMLEFGLGLVDGLASLSVSEPAALKNAELRERPVVDFVRMRLDKRLKAFLKESRDLLHCAPERQHDIRVQAKKLRYAVEGFHPVIGAKESRKLTAALVRLQDLLGELNDARTGRVIALAYARERAGGGGGEPTLFAAGLAAAACTLDPTAALSRAAEAREELAALARS
ncbi:MAG TPA: CHAD domain-containing protein [Bosea sp. (in: a-proteobacteria)]